ncbi:DUF961 domain-containing protein [Enterococcus faecalis]|uniref:DUF961 domain-containing protein n=1 Tax=Enterococcus faecalis TaxID=1351 RepID=UPI001AD63913|nr:DUF961 domain-containing protein [Enterococcus faecalis]MBO6438750.1 DUF961 domain-containing protein [Enterococcus faecalis]MBO6453361.1 DUF961 domain-containing protein [Enterococcus faecalis]
MAKERPINFEDNQIPLLFKETVGVVTFVAVRSDKFRTDETGNRTDEIRAQSIEVSSEKQKENFNIDLPPLFNLSAENLAFGDSIDVEGVKSCEAWAMLSSADNNIRNAATGFSLVAERVRKISATNQSVKQTNEKVEKK